MTGNADEWLMSVQLSKGCCARNAKAFDAMSAMSDERLFAIMSVATTVLKGLSWRRSVLGVD